MHPYWQEGEGVLPIAVGLGRCFGLRRGM